MSNARVPADAEGMSIPAQGETPLGINYLRRGMIVATTIGTAHDDENPEHVATLFAPGINPAALVGLSLIDLRSMRDALHVTLEVVSALSCQPRFASSQPSLFNGAGEALDELSQNIAEALEAIVFETKRRSPIAAADVEAKAQIIAAQHLEDGGNFPSLSQHAAQAANDIAQANTLEAAQ